MAFAGPRREDSKAGLKAGVSRLGRSITQSLSEKSRSSPALGKVRAMASNVKAAAHSVEDKLHVVEDKLEGRHLTGEELLSSVLAIFDRDSDGYLMPVELKHILTAVHVWGVRKYTDEEIDELVKQYDSDGDGRFSVAELTKALSNLRLTEKALRHAAEGLPPPPPPPRPLPDVLGTEWLNMGPEPLGEGYEEMKHPNLSTALKRAPEVVVNMGWPPEPTGIRLLTVAEHEDLELDYLQTNHFVKSGLDYFRPIVPAPPPAAAAFAAIFNRAKDEALENAAPKAGTKLLGLLGKKKAAPVAAPAPAPAPEPPPEPEEDPRLKRMTPEEQAKFMVSLKLVSKLKMLVKRRKLAAQISTWNEGYLNASEVKEALVDSKVVDAAWLAELAATGHAPGWQPKPGAPWLPRCQDVPSEAVVTLDDMERSSFTGAGLLSTLIVSAPWLDEYHPDKQAAQLKRLAFVLKAFAKKAGEEWAGNKQGGGKCGVYWDYLAMPQPSPGAAKRGEDDRTPKELEKHKRAMAGVGAWFANPLTSVLMVDTELPEEAPEVVARRLFLELPSDVRFRAATNRRARWPHMSWQAKLSAAEELTTFRALVAKPAAYKDRGWCRMEFKAAAMAKDSRCLLSLSRLTGQEKEWSEISMKGAVINREPPMAPTAFAIELKSGVQSGEVWFATGFTGDDPKNRVERIMACLTKKQRKAVAEYCGWGGLGWDGKLERIETLEQEGSISWDKELEAAMKAEVQAEVEAEAMAKANAEAEAAAKVYDGAFLRQMDKLTLLNYGHMGWNDAQGVQLFGALRHAHTCGGLQNLERLYLHENHLGDFAIKSLVFLLDQGGLPKLQELFLTKNDVSSRGVRNLASAISRGRLPAIARIEMKGNPGSLGLCPVQAALEQRKVDNMVLEELEQIKRSKQ